MALSPEQNLIYRLQKVCLMCNGKGTITKSEHVRKGCENFEETGSSVGCLIPFCFGNVEHDCPQCLAIKGVFDHTT